MNRNLGIALFAFLLPVSGLFAQGDRASITGIVSDPSGAVIPRARVNAVNLATSVASSAASNSSGVYYLLVLPGAYRVTVTMDGFATARVERVVLTVNQAATLNFSLEPASVRQEITITAPAPLLEQQQASLGSTIQSEKILNLPLLGRNAYTLVVLAPAVIPKGNAGTGPLINGGRSNANALLLDGGQVLNSTTNDSAYTPPLESVEEFKVQTNSFSAEFGRTGGGVVNVTTKMGANQTHGSFYEFLRNSKLNANSYSRNLVGLPRDVLKRNEFGATIGAPVWLPKLYNGKDRTFFFFNWEAIRQRSPNSIIATVPTALERAGDFSKTLGADGKPILIYDPATTRGDPSRAGAFLRAAFQGNRVPAARLDPVALKVLPFFPEPNAAGDPVTGQRNFLKAGRGANATDRILFRIDHSISNRQRIFGRLGWDQGQQDTNIRVNDAFPRQTSTSIEPIFNTARSFILSDAITFRPNLIAELRGGYTRNRRDSRPTSLGFDVASLGFSSSMAGGVRARVFPGFDVGDVATLGPDTTALRLSVQENRQGQGTLTWVGGRHTVKAGGDLEAFRNNTYSPSSPAGNFGFGRVFTQGPDPARASAGAGNGVATFLLGLPTSGALTMDPALATQQIYSALFFQDSVRLTRTLSFDLGLRWEYTTPWKDRFNQLAYFDPAAADPLTGRSGLLRFVGGDRRGQTDPDRNNFGPRLGLAWSFAPRLVFRAGYGVFYSQGNGGIGAVSNELGSGFQTSTPVYLGPPDQVPFRPPISGSLSNPFSTGFNVPPSNLVGGTASSTLRRYLTPLNHQWNASVQRQVSQDLLVETAYSASRGEHLWQGYAMNAVTVDKLALGADLLAQVPNPFYGKITTGSLSAPTVARRQLLAPYPHYSSVTQFRGTIGDSIYHALTLRVDKRFAQGFSFMASYTAGKLIDNTGEHFSSRTSLSNPNDLRRDRSLADYDVAQRLVMSYVWEIPLGPGRRWLRQGVLSYVLGGWQLNGITSFQSGFPVVVTTPNVTNLPGVSSRAKRLRSGRVASGQTPDRYFDTSAFAPADPYTLGTDSRTQPDLRAPGIRNFDFSLNRSQRITERVRLQFRGEIFNLFNTPQLDAPDESVTGRTFGRIMGGGGNRVIQLGLRLAY